MNPKSISKLPSKPQQESIFKIHNRFNYSDLNSSSHPRTVKTLYTVWIRIDETLPWIELKGEYATKNEARKAVKEAMKRLETKIVNLPEKRTPMKMLAPMKTR